MYCGFKISHSFIYRRLASIGQGLERIFHFVYCLVVALELVMSHLNARLERRFYRRWVAPCGTVHLGFVIGCLE